MMTQRSASDWSAASCAVLRLWSLRLLVAWCAPRCAGPLRAPTTLSRRSGVTARLGRRCSGQQNSRTTLRVLFQSAGQRQATTGQHLFLRILHRVRSLCTVRTLRSGGIVLDRLRTRITRAEQQGMTLLTRFSEHPRRHADRVRRVPARSARSDAPRGAFLSYSLDLPRPRREAQPNPWSRTARERTIPTSGLPLPIRRAAFESAEAETSLSPKKVRNGGSDHLCANHALRRQGRIEPRLRDGGRSRLRCGSGARGPPAALPAERITVQQAEGNSVAATQ